MDAYGHVNNVVFLTYLEEARIDMFFHHAEDQGASLSGGVVVARHEVDYRKPLVYHPLGVDIDVWITHIGGAHVAVAYEVYDEKTRFAEAASVLVAYDLKAERPRRFTAAERAFMGRYLEPPSAAPSRTEGR